jgi:hypothetical protein
MISSNGRASRSALFVAPVRLVFADYLIIGPTNAGKTNLLASLYKAAISPRELPPSVSVKLFATSQPMRDLASLAEDIPFRPDILPGTVDTRAYEFDLTFSEFALGGLRRRDAVTRFSMLDGPGGALVESGQAGPSKESRDRLLRRLRDAAGVVLCVDGTAGADSDAAREYWNRLPHALSAALGAERLRADRVVVCITKADQCFLERGPGARRAIEASDPAEYARQFLPVGAQRSLKKHLHSNVTLGFAWVSTWGFLPDGSPNCREATAGGFEPLTAVPNSAAAASSSWVPYHVLDPFLFVGYGYTRATGVRVSFLPE